ncbi:MAG: hypothetical protein AVDCRST_MAG64-4465 [uncultured Phycisphaerae bacterium]|uniref:Uncharacterized protein n=1 Tax=uncultured Phycisphaerae bacterium TaxID=904963 RepID=A0A6J4QHM2_9BACT|nr:MAG: hypothetical protein AVDCRST_MAG64-4465 [uncultured Phycisphaerae bacterium]
MYRAGCGLAHHRLANHAIDDLDRLHAEAKRHVRAVTSEQRLLEACFKSAALRCTHPALGSRTI